jgi:hypothetical protein
VRVSANLVVRFVDHVSFSDDHVEITLHESIQIIAFKSFGRRFLERPAVVLYLIDQKHYSETEVLVFQS